MLLPGGGHHDGDDDACGDHDDGSGHGDDHDYVLVDYYNLGELDGESTSLFQGGDHEHGYMVMMIMMIVILGSKLGRRIVANR